MKLIKKLFIYLIKLYQWTLGPFTQGHCRFYPTCSHYSIETFQKYPFYKAIYLTLKRIIKCCGLHPGGHDPVE